MKTQIDDSAERFEVETRGKLHAEIYWREMMPRVYV